MIGMLHYERYTPIVSLIFSVLITIIMFVGQDIFSLINYFSFTNWLWTGVAVLSGIFFLFFVVKKLNFVVNRNSITT